MVHEYNGVRIGLPTLNEPLEPSQELVFVHGPPGNVKVRQVRMHCRWFAAAIEEVRTVICTSTCILYNNMRSAVVIIRSSDMDVKMESIAWFTSSIQGRRGYDY